MCIQVFSSPAPLVPLSSCPVRLFVFAAPLSARQDCDINVRKRLFPWCKAAMTTSAMFHSDLSISVNKYRHTFSHCHSLLRGDSHTLLLVISAGTDAFEWKCCRCTYTNTESVHTPPAQRQADINTCSMNRKKYICTSTCP